MDRLRRSTIAAIGLSCLMTVNSSGCASGTRTEADRSTTTTTTNTDAVGGTSTSSTTASGGDRYDLTEVGAAVDEFVAAEGLNGAGLVVVERDAGVVYEHYAGEFDGERVSLIASSSKMITAGVLMRLDDQGTLDVSAPVADGADWGASHPDITPEQLVSNSSGLIGLVGDPASRSYVCQFIAARTLQDCAEEIFTTPGDDNAVVPPDTEFRYGGAQWQVAGAVAELASGSSWAELVEETYVAPCGLSSLGYNNHFSQIMNPDGPFRYPTQFDGDPAQLSATENPNMEGGAYISPRDYATLLLMHLRDGKCGSTRVLSTRALERMHSDRIGPEYDGTTGGKLEGYGFGWWVDRDNPSYIEDAGAFGAVPWLDLEHHYGVYLVVEDTSSTGHRLAALVRPLIDAELGD